MYVAEKDFGGNLVTAGIMIVAQFLGAFAGILWGYLALLAPDATDGADYSVPPGWVGATIPLIPPAFPDYGEGKDGYTRNWQCFWGILMATIMLSLGYVTIKHKATRFSEDSVLNSGLFYAIQGAVVAMSLKFGPTGINPALASAYMVLTVTQDTNVSADHYNHYLWVYMLVPFLGGAIGGVLHWIHTKCVEKQGADNDREELIPTTEN